MLGIAKSFKASSDAEEETWQHHGVDHSVYHVGCNLFGREADSELPSRCEVTEGTTSVCTNSTHVKCVRTAEGLEASL